MGDCANVLPFCDASETWYVYRFGVEFLWKENEVCSRYFTECNNAYGKVILYVAYVAV